ncbi:MAG TPA: hypothetical protein PL183_14045, partial [Aquamicrobium sp.]|nr:hypothetical protein [Aquamicrobium sp.]
MPAPGHPFPRYLYAIELALFALPTVGVLAPFLGLLAALSAAYLSGDPVRSPRHRRKFWIGALL